MLDCPEQIHKSPKWTSFNNLTCTNYHFSNMLIMNILNLLFLFWHNTSRTSEMLDNGCSNFKSHILFWSIDILNSNDTSPLKQIILYYVNSKMSEDSLKK